MKRILSMALAAALLIAALSACGGDDAKNTGIPSEPAGENTAAPATQPGDASQEPSMDMPTEEPSEAPQTPDGSANVDLAAFAQTLQDNHDFSGFLNRVDPEDADMGEMMAQMLDTYYAGLSDMDLEQLEVYMSMISFSSGEFALAQAKSADDAAKVKEIFQARIDSKSTEGPGNYPDEVEMWLRCAKLEVNGNYVMLVCCEDSEAIVNEFNELFK